MVAQQAYPTFNPERAALVTAILSRGSRAAALPTYRARQIEEPAQQLPVYRNAPGSQSPSVVRTPERDERLVGDAGAELAARSQQQHLPTYSTPTVAEVTPAAYPDDARRGYLDRLAHKPEDKNGRLRSGANLALFGPSQPTDSLGNMAGQALGRFFVGVARPSLDEEQEQARELPRYRAAAAAEAAQEQEGRERAQAAATLRKTNADATNAENLPTYNQQKTDEKSRSDQRRALASIYNKLPEFDPSDPDNAEMVQSMRDAGLPVVQKKGNQQLRFVQDAKSGAWTVVAGDKQTGTATSSGVTAPGGAGQLTTVSSQAMTAEQQEANRQSAERIAQWRIKAQKEIAASSQAIQRDRLKMSADQFSKRYPGAGKTLTPEAIAKKAKALGMLEEDAAKEAVKQGYTILDQ